LTILHPLKYAPIQRIGRNIAVHTLAFIDLTLGMVVGHDQEKALSDCNKIVQMYITLKIDFPTT